MLFRSWMNIPSADVLSDVITPNSLGKSRYDVIEAVRACLEVGADYRVACTFNVLAGGIEVAEEAYQVARIGSSSIVTIDPESIGCIQTKFALAPWKLYGECSASCGQGFKSRTRDIYTMEEKNGAQLHVRCGNMSQTTHCYASCDAIPIWGKCADWGHMVTFGNRLYDLHAQGEFMLYQSVSLKEQINVLHAFPKVVSMSENEGKVYTDMAVPVGYAFRFGPDVLEIGLKAPRYAEPSFRFNGEMLANIKERHSIGLFTIERDGKVQGSKNDDLLIEVRVPGGARLTVAFSHVDRISRVVGYIEIPGSEMGSTRGMCGSFDMNPQNDFADASGVIQSQPARAAWSWRVQKSDSLFSDMLPKVQEPENFDNFAPTNVTDDSDVLKGVRSLSCGSEIQKVFVPLHDGDSSLRLRGCAAGCKR